MDSEKHKLLEKQLDTAKNIVIKLSNLKRLKKDIIDASHFNLTFKLESVDIFATFNRNDGTKKEILDSFLGILDNHIIKLELEYKNL